VAFDRQNRLFQTRELSQLRNRMPRRKDT
jgi:hypothetical protein